MHSFHRAILHLAHHHVAVCIHVSGEKGAESIKHRHRSLLGKRQIKTLALAKYLGRGFPSKNRWDGVSVYTVSPISSISFHGKVSQKEIYIHFFNFFIVSEAKTYEINFLHWFLEIKDVGSPFFFPKLRTLNVKTYYFCTFLNMFIH